MNEFTIYCTREQTKKALKLGAPIDSVNHYTAPNHPSFVDILHKGNAWFLPTAEQMCGWLRSKGIVARGNCYSKVNKDLDIPDWQVLDYNEEKSRWHEKFFGHADSYEAATLAAIDAALDYLTNKK